MYRHHALTLIPNKKFCNKFARNLGKICIAKLQIIIVVAETKSFRFCQQAQKYVPQEYLNKFAFKVVLSFLL